MAPPTAEVRSASGATRDSLVEQLLNDASMACKEGSSPL